MDTDAAVAAVGSTGRISVSRARTLAVTGYIALAVMSLTVWRVPPDLFVLTQWRYSYEVGFMRRGLPGTLLDAVADGSIPSINTAALVLFAATVLTASYLIAAVTVDADGVSPIRTVLAVALALSPAGFPFLAANFGRFDTPALLLMLLAVALLGRDTPWWRVVPAALLLGVSVAVHEAALATYVVWTVVWAWDRAGWPAAAACAAVPAGVTAALQAPNLTVGQFQWWLASRSDWPITGDLETTVPYQTTGEAVEFTYAWLSTSTGARWAVLSILAVLPVLALIAVAFRRSVRWADLKVTERAMYGASLAPLGLMVVGMDYGRWWSLSTILLVATTLVVLRRHVEAKTSAATSALAITCVAMTVMAGGTQHLAFVGGLL